VAQNSQNYADVLLRNNSINKVCQKLQKMVDSRESKCSNEEGDVFIG